MDAFGRDPNTGEGMLATAERVASDAGFSKPQLDELTAVRYAQYADSLAGDRAFQRKWMVPIEAGSARRPSLIEDDQGVRPTGLAELEALGPVNPDGVVSFGTQTHPADGTAGFILSSPAVARERGVSGPLAKIISTGFARVPPGTMPKAPVPAAAAALEAAGLGYGDVQVIKTHNPFAVNDLWFARETGVDPELMNPYGCSLVYGHPQGPTGARAIIELMHALEERGGGIGMFTGCAAGDTGAAVVLEVSD
jgi:acetyl-CoA C-acetyltransferase